MNSKLYRSSEDRMLGGVCGGLARYMNLDSTLVRIIFLLLAASGVGTMIYLVLWVVLPSAADPDRQFVTGEAGKEIEERVRAMGEDIRQAAEQPHPQAATFLGAALVIVGGVLFLNALGLPWLAWLRFDTLWPLLLILGGVLILARRFRGG